MFSTVNTTEILSAPAIGENYEGKGKPDKINQQGFQWKCNREKVGNGEAGEWCWLWTAELLEPGDP